jgi:hypothetical protein
VSQAGVALTKLTGFANGRLRFKPGTWILLGQFTVSWLVWLLAGFPQLSGQVILTPLALSIAFSDATVYAINRGMKFLLFLVFLSFFSNWK